MKNSKGIKKWEDQARQFFGDDFWDDIMSVIPDNQQPASAPSKESTHTPQSRSTANAPSKAPNGQPAIDIFKTDRQFLVLVDLPGLRDVEGIDVYLQQDRLVVSGKVARPFSEYQTLQSERFTGEFKRVIPLPEAVEEDKIQARYVNGVLEIRIPRQTKPNAPKKRIRIQHDKNSK